MNPVLFLIAAAVNFPADDGSVDYTEQIKPILAAKCFSCHGALKQESGLRLDAATLIRKGGDSGPAIVAGNAAKSLLVERISATDPLERMPPEGEGEPLTAEQIALFKVWIGGGAIAPDEPVPLDPREHWAFQPPKPARPPHVKNAAWVRNRIDAYLAAQHDQAGLLPARPARRHVLLRRVFVDLIGVPPTRAELHDFLTDDSPRAYERVVDRLLQSPLYGERWGRHWMDVWRYSDWTGFGNEIRYSQRHIWRWRDWIVESLNQDKGYDRMILEMLAADELSPGNEDAVRATGFLARNWYKFDRNVWLDDVIEHSGKAFLGMTFKCARCHDHKYDPISQAEYYRLRAIFEPYNVRLDRTPGELDTNSDGLARIYDAKPDAATYFFERGDPKRADKEHPVEPGVPAVIGRQLNVQPVSLPLESYYPAMRQFVAHDMVEQAEAAMATAKAELASLNSKSSESTDSQTQQADPEDAKAESAKTSEQDVALAEKKLATAEAVLAATKARIAAERAKHVEGQQDEALAKAAGKAERLAALARADQKLTAARQELDRARRVAKEDDEKSQKAVQTAEKKRDAAQKAFDKAQESAGQEAAAYQPLGPTYPQTSTGRRSAFARWIVDRENPLTARVAVNHIWLRHFGRPLVERVDDFGLRSPRPPLGGLLDHLAVEFMENAWSMKHVHRLIVTSSAYRMSSNPVASPSSKQDPDNELFWRMTPRRLEAEAVRDSVLYVAGSLDLKQGGPDIDFRQGLTVPRRSLYFRHARERQMKFLRMFDAANPRECYRRQESIRPQQAFALVNSSLLLAQSRLLATRLTTDDDRAEGKPPRLDDGDFVTAAFETVLSRRPSQSEMSACREFLDEQARRFADSKSLELLGTAANSVPPASDPQQRARENLVLVLFNHNGFVTVR